MKVNYTKLFFGVIVFLFSVSLAYFSADYLASGADANSMFVTEGGRGLAMFGFGLLYALLGVVLVRIMPVALGFLLAADVALLDALARNYDKIEGMYRVGMIGIVLVVVYLFAAFNCKDKVSEMVEVAIPTNS
jgi:hypothetical protein